MSWFAGWFGEGGGIVIVTEYVVAEIEVAVVAEGELAVEVGEG